MVKRCPNLGRFKTQLRQGAKMGLFINIPQPYTRRTATHSGYDWLLVDSNMT